MPSNLHGWCLAGLLWSWPTCWSHLLASMASTIHSRSQKPTKKCPKKSCFCILCLKTKGVRPRGAVQPYVPKNIVYEGTFSFKTLCPPIANTFSFWWLKIKYFGAFHHFCLIMVVLASKTHSFLCALHYQLLSHILFRSKHYFENFIWFSWI